MADYGSHESTSTTHSRGAWRVIGSTLPRLVGLVLLVALLIRVDIGAFAEILKGADTLLVFCAVVLLVVLIGIKTIRWQAILRRVEISIRTPTAFLAYFASMFIGFLTPGRLGEFGRALYVRDESKNQSGVAFSSVLADRLFDLYALILVGGAGIFSLGTPHYWAWSCLLFTVSVVPVMLFLNEGLFVRLQNFAQRSGRIGQVLFDNEGWLMGMRRGLKRMNSVVFILCVLLTVVAYAVFFSQCYLLSVALGIDVGFLPIMFAVALGSLITLLPFSISGLGTREATITAYLSTVGVAAEVALSFSLLVFATFYVAGGLLGAMAWWIRPIPLNLRQRKADLDSYEEA